MLLYSKTDSLSSVRLLVRKIQKRALISGLIVGLLLAFFWSRSVGFGFLSGVAIGVVNFQLMSVDAYTMVEKNPRKARKFIIGRAMLRYTIMYGFLALVALRTDFNIFAAFVGLFLIKIILIGGHIIEGLGFSGKAYRG